METVFWIWFVCCCFVFLFFLISIFRLFQHFLIRGSSGTMHNYFNKSFKRPVSSGHLKSITMKWWIKMNKIFIFEYRFLFTVLIMNSNLSLQKPKISLKLPCTSCLRIIVIFESTTSPDMKSGRDGRKRKDAKRGRLRGKPLDQVWNCHLMPQRMETDSLMDGTTYVKYYWNGVYDGFC